MIIGIVGAGNLGTAIAADLGRKNQVRIYSSKAKEFSKEIVWKDIDTGDEWSAGVELVSDSYADVVPGCDIIFIVVPTFMTKRTIDNILPYLSKNTILGFVPGAGGVEFLASDVTQRGQTIFGFERVPYVARLETYGKAVQASKKSKYRIASIPKDRAPEICQIIETLFDRPCFPMTEFISMTLTPSLHTSRLYDLYKDCRADQELDDNPYFYREWRDSASYLTFELDTELHNVCDALTANGINADEVVPYPIHYESATPELLTKKLKSIQSLADIHGPLIKKDNGKYILDINSRYFTESYPYRLCIVKGLAELLNLYVPKTDEVLHWYEKIAGKEYYNGDRFEGKDIVECNIPQNRGIFSIDGLRNIYL